ncbi:MAG: L-2-amino-thiazoline-4-carboxylic acid hydrolase [Candidatus Hodarchaeota archaeon]
MQNNNKNNDLYNELWAKIKTIRQSWRKPNTLKKLIDDWVTDYGTQMDKVAEKIIADKVRLNWSNYASNNDLSTLDEFIKSAWEGWTEGKFSIERSEKGVQIFCTKCPMAEAYRTIGKENYGLIFHCSEDPHMVEGFNPELKFHRTKTLMNGDDCCNHFYTNHLSH